jgi:hypothetical protein
MDHSKMDHSKMDHSHMMGHGDMDHGDGGAMCNMNVSLQAVHFFPVPLESEP